MALLKHQNIKILSDLKWRRNGILNYVASSATVWIPGKTTGNVGQEAARLGLWPIYVRS